MLPQRPLPMGLAPHGLFNTVRARWLATICGAAGSGRVTPRAAGAVDTLAPASTDAEHKRA